MTPTLIAAVFGAPVLGLIAALAWRGWRGKQRGSLDGIAAATAVIAAAIGLLGDLLPRAVSALSLYLSPLPAVFYGLYADVRFALPAIAGLLATLVLVFPIIGRRPLAAAVLTPRSPLSFIRRRWLIPPGITLGLLTAVTIACGVASEPDETGRYTRYTMNIGGEYAMGATTYGWFYSLPTLAITGAMIVVAWISLALIARPAVAEGDEADARGRMLRSRNVVVATTATLFVVLSQALGLLAGAAGVRARFDGFTFWTPIAALEPALHVTAFITAALGVACWVSVALTAAQNRSRILTPATA